MGRAQQHSVQQFKRILLNSKRHRMLIGLLDERVYVSHQLGHVDGLFGGQPLYQHAEQVVQAGKGSGEFFSIFEFHSFLPRANYPLPSICAANVLRPLQNGYLFGRRYMEGFPMTRRNWNRIQPTSLRHALELCKDYAKARHNLSVERIAERMGLDDHWTLYKWISNARMPAVCIRSYETACGIDYATRWLAASANRLLIDIPTGRNASAADMQALQELLNTAVGQLLQFYGGKSPAADTLAAIQQAMEGLAWHRRNVEKHTQPELDFQEE